MTQAKMCAPFGERRGRLFPGMARWLDGWAVGAYSQDTHAWSAKQETLRGLKRTERQTA